MLSGWTQGWWKENEMLLKEPNAIFKENKTKKVREIIWRTRNESKIAESDPGISEEELERRKRNQSKCKGNWWVISRMKDELM